MLLPLLYESLKCSKQHSDFLLAFVVLILQNLPRPTQMFLGLLGSEEVHVIMKNFLSSQPANIPNGFSLKTPKELPFALDYNNFIIGTCLHFLILANVLGTRNDSSNTDFIQTPISTFNIYAINRLSPLISKTEKILKWMPSYHL